MEKQYSREIQNLYISSGFGLIKSKESSVLDREPLETIVSKAKETAPLLISLILSVEPTTSSASITTHLAFMKLIAILVILYKLAHQNNSNYVPLLIAMYLYLVGA